MLWVCVSRAHAASLTLSEGTRWRMPDAKTHSYPTGLRLTVNLFLKLLGTALLHTVCVPEGCLHTVCLPRRTDLVEKCACSRRVWTLASPDAFVNPSPSFGW